MARLRRQYPDGYLDLGREDGELAEQGSERIEAIRPCDDDSSHIVLRAAKGDQALAERFLNLFYRI